MFADRSDLIADRNTHSGVPIAITDMNGDGLDDIVALHQTNELRIQYQSPDRSRGFIQYKESVVIENSDQNDICIGDFNNDGYNDILAVGFYDRIKLITAVPGTTEFVITYINVEEFYSQGASAGDFNHDGWLDAVLLNDNGYNYCMMNDGAGNLSLVDYFDFHTVPASDDSGNYGCVYTDFDMDGDLDFYIAKCRQGVNSPTDPRRINVLFVNDGNGVYTESAAAYGLASGAQTWTADFGDFDNDGDMDCFMTQHDIICELFENIDNDTFINITTQSGLAIGGIPLQGMFADFDNDGFLDILAAGDRVDLYRNNGDKTFSAIDPFENKIFGTFGLGDLNHDGKIDIYGSTVEPFNNPHPFRPDYFFMNTSDGIIPHHYLSLSLNQPIENTSAIGAMALVYGEWGVQVREVRGGEQYGVSNSHTLYFGLGLSEIIDSVVVRWPDGSKENLGSLVPDKHYFITKGGCFHEDFISEPFLHVLCGEDSLIAKRPIDMELVKWSTGETTDSIVIKEPGIYYAVLNSSGCDIKLYSFEVIKDPDVDNPSIIYNGDLTLCATETALLSLPDGFSYLWNTGETSQVIFPSESGDYSATIEGYCKDLFTDTISLDFISSEIYSIENDTVFWGQTATLVAHGDSVHWYDAPIFSNLIGLGDTLLIPNITSTYRVFARSEIKFDGESGSVGPAMHQGNSFYNGNTINGGLVFDVHQTMVWDSFTVFTGFPGLRTFEIFDENGNWVHDFSFELIDGQNIVPVQYELSPGTYTITTNSDQNLTELGMVNPRLYRSNELVIFPYTYKDIVSITTSTFGEEFYYYFYDWKVSELETNCRSSFVEVEAFLDLSSNTNFPESLQNLTVNPNPATDRIELKGDALHSTGTVTIFNAVGQLMHASTTSTALNSISIGEWSSGQYFIKVEIAEGVRTIGFVKL